MSLKQNITTTYYIVLILSFVGCSTPNKIHRVKDSQIKSITVIPQKIEIIKSDSVNSYFGIKNDEIYSDKVFPPKGSKYDENLGNYNPNAESEGLAIKTAVLSCFNNERYQKLVDLKASVLMHMYADDKGIIKEVILISMNNETFFTEKEMILIINKVKGLKVTIPPSFVNFSYYLCGQMIWFK